MKMCLLNRFAEVVGLLELGFAVNVAGVHVAAGENVAKIFPAQVFHEVVVILDDVIEPMAFGRHEQSRGALAAQKIAVSFFEGEETVDTGTQLAAEVPVVEGRGEDDDVGIFHRWIDLVHVVLLHARRVLHAVTTEAAAAAVDVHAAEGEGSDGVADAFGTFGESGDEGRGVAVFAWAAV